MKRAWSALSASALVAAAVACRPAATGGPATSGTAPGASGSAASSTSPSASAPARAYEPLPTFSLAAVRDGTIGLHVLGERLVLNADLGFVVVDDDGAIHVDPVAWKGLPMGAAETTLPWIAELGGRWPDGAWLTLNVIGDSGATFAAPEVYRFGKDGWTVAQSKVERSAGAPDDHASYAYVDFAPWSSGRVLGLAAYVSTTPGVEPTVADFRAAPPRLDVLSGEAGVAPPDVDPAICPDHLVALASGEIFVLGQACTDGVPVVERWAQPGTRGVVEKIAAPECSRALHYVRDVEARAADDAWVAVELTCDEKGGSYLSHWDGRAWQLVQAPDPTGVVTSLAIGGSGVLWATVDGTDGSALWRRWIDGRWEAVPLPPIDAEHPAERLSAKEVAARGDEVWVVAGRYEDHHYRGSVLLHSRPAKELARLPSEVEIRAAAADETQPALATSACTHPFLAIGALPPDADAHFEYKELRAALHGHDAFKDVELREVSWRGERWVGAVASYGDVERLRALLVEKLFGARPQAYCGFYPKVLRTFTIDPQSEEISDR